MPQGLREQHGFLRNDGNLFTQIMKSYVVGVDAVDDD